MADSSVVSRLADNVIYHLLDYGPFSVSILLLLSLFPISQRTVARRDAGAALPPLDALTSSATLLYQPIVWSWPPLSPSFRFSSAGCFSETQKSVLWASHESLHPLPSSNRDRPDGHTRCPFFRDAKACRNAAITAAEASFSTRSEDVSAVVASHSFALPHRVCGVYIAPLSGVLFDTIAGVVVGMRDIAARGYPSHFLALPTAWALAADAVVASLQARLMLFFTGMAVFGYLVWRCVNVMNVSPISASASIRDEGLLSVSGVCTTCKAPSTMVFSKGQCIRVDHECTPSAGIESRKNERVQAASAAKS